MLGGQSQQPNSTRKSRDKSAKDRRILVYVNLPAATREQFSVRLSTVLHQVAQNKLLILPACRRDWCLLNWAAQTRIRDSISKIHEFLRFMKL